MKKYLLITALFFSIFYLNNLFAQTNPAITSWLINNEVTGNYYAKGNSTLIPNNILVNVQKVQFSSDWAYIKTNGIPSYPTGPFLDGNPSIATNQNAIFKISLKPLPNSGTPTNTNGGNIGIFINGVALFDYRDGVSWSSASNSLKGGPIGGMGDNVWNRDAVVAEKAGFDCAKGHPAKGNYHHHQNPSAFKLDKTVVSDICSLYDADGLYIMDETKHSPLIGFAYDGFPIYGAFGFKSTDGTGEIVRIKSGFKLRDITQRTTYYDGSSVKSGPDVNSAYPLGYFREDYEYIESQETEVLDIHNGRFCVTPEYPNGTYAYFCTVDENLNSAYPYAVGPTFYGVKNAQKVATINETVEDYDPLSSVKDEISEFLVFPNSANEFIAIQIKQVQNNNLILNLLDLNGKLVAEGKLVSGSTISYMDINSLYSGCYTLIIKNGNSVKTENVVILKN